jgi:hypothetical protein
MIQRNFSRLLQAVERRTATLALDRFFAAQAL